MARLPFGEGPDHRAVAAVLRDDAAFLRRDEILTESSSISGDEEPKGQLIERGFDENVPCPLPRS
jgi:hypothetical protein